MKSKTLTAAVMFINIILVKSECDGYSDCLREFFNSFYGNNEKFEQIEIDNNNNSKTINSSDVHFESGDIDDIVSGVSRFLQNELKGNKNTEQIIFQNIDNNTKIFVKTFTTFGDNDNDEISELFSEYNIKDVGDLNNYTISAENTIKNHSEATIKEKEITSIPHKTKDIHENEIPDTIDDLNLFDDYFGEDNGTDYQIIDYLDLYKDTTNEYIDYNPTESYNNSNEDANINEDKNGKYYIGKNDDKKTDTEKTIFPWVAAMFVKRGSSDQFDYYCDGAILSNRAVIIAARCVRNVNSTVGVDDLIILLGKTSLQSTGQNERAVKVKEVIVHENFTLSRPSVHDVAILLLDESVLFTGSIQPARFDNATDFTNSYTTGWSVSGDLSVVQFVNDQSANCVRDSPENIFCAVFGSDVTVCPSYGGVYVVERNESLYLHGIRTSDPTERELCTNDPVYYTSLDYLEQWISDMI